METLEVHNVWLSLMFVDSAAVWFLQWFREPISFFVKFVEIQRYSEVSSFSLRSHYRPSSPRAATPNSGEYGSVEEFNQGELVHKL
jgi:hypothetical protein